MSMTTMLLCASIELSSMFTNMTHTCNPMLLWPLIHHRNSYSGKVVTSCMGITRPCIPENFKGKTISLWNPFILSHRYAGKKNDGILVPLKQLSYEIKMESNKHNTIRREGDPPAVACGNRRERQKASYQIPGIHVQHKSEKFISSGIQTTFPLQCERLYWDPWNG
jgi:hypothetical protein